MRIIKIKLSFSNAYLVQDQQTILVDTGMPGEEQKILRAAQSVGIDIANISLILHTHAHVDHAGSTASLQRILGVPVAVHPLDASMLRNGKMNRLRPLRFEARLIKPVVSRPFPPIQPDLLVDESTDLSTFGVAGHILHTPGHTAGSISVIFSNGQAIVGDVMMGGYLGGNILASRPNYHYFADDLAQVRASIQKIIGAQVNAIYVGHGGPLEAGVVVRTFSSDIRF